MPTKTPLRELREYLEEWYRIEGETFDKATMARSLNLTRSHYKHVEMGVQECSKSVALLCADLYRPRMKDIDLTVEDLIRGQRVSELRQLPEPHTA